MVDVKGLWRRLAELASAPTAETPRAPPPQPKDPTRCALDFFSDRFLTIRDLGFFGQFSRSPNGRYVVGWSDRSPDGSRGGHRYDGEGRWILLEGDRLIAQGNLQRPQDGKVADDGTVLISDWLFGDGLDGVLAGFSSEGQQLLHHVLAANINDHALSPDGRMAICRTLNSPGSSDSCKLILFDVHAGRELARWDPEPVSVAGYEFDTDADLVHVVTEDGDRAAYDFTGRLVNATEWQRARIGRGDLNVIKPAIELAGPDAASGDIAAILQGLAVACSTDADWLRARAFRAKGELLEKLDRDAEALEAYDSALLLDPQVGVFRRSEKLRRAVGGTSKTKPPRKRRLEKQADRFGMKHEVVELEKGENKLWRSAAFREWTSIENAALEHYLDGGWSGAAAEGGLILTVIKAASFARLAERNADTYIEALYAQNVAFDEDRYAIGDLLASVRRADIGQLRRNWALISKRSGETPAFYPGVWWDGVEGLFKALGNERLAAIADRFSSAPYDLRAGWPDLTLWRADEVRFVEVKGPSDSIHASQARLVRDLLNPLAHHVTLAEIIQAT